jgi:3-oxoacyl-[acyl-carrier-protein] synthase-1
MISGSHAGTPPVSYRYGQQELGDPSCFLSDYLQLFGPALTISTACSSSARAIITGKRLIESGMVDAAIVGGADTLSRMPINGFNSLESLSNVRCKPFSAERNGITVGEAGALILLTQEAGKVQLLGVGESSDAWHMSAPHPEGVGAIRAIEMALREAKLTPCDIGYINMHGTATRLNDEIEAKVVNQLFGENVPASSTKHLTGHTLGAAGACEAVLCYLLLSRGLTLPAQDFTDAHQDLSLAACGLLSAPQPFTKSVMLSNSFAFGGNNASLIFGVSHD